MTPQFPPSGPESEPESSAGPTMAATVDAAPSSVIEAVSPDMAPVPDWDGPHGWQPLPRRAYRVFLYVALLVAAIPAGITTLSLGELLLRREGGWIALAALWAVTIALALWVAHKRYRYTFWRLDQHGFAVRRGRLWQWETRVPTSRVQHMDLKRGPLERAHRLASLVLHTAGTRLSAVSISGLDDADAERVRDHFSRQIDRQDDDDHA